MDHAIRLATPKDLQAIEDIVQAAYSGYIPRIGQKPGPMLDDYQLLTAQGRVYVLESDGAVQGLLVLIPEDGVMLLDNVAVAPRSQGQGLGRALLAFAEQMAKASGCRAIRLYTNEAMAENIGLYARLGYLETHRAQDQGFRRVYMSKQLG